jgi:hypothetical protein
MEIERKVPEKKMVKILLSSCSLVGHKEFRCSEGEKKKVKVKKMFGSWVTPLVGRHVVNEPKVGCHVVMSLKYRKSDFRWIIHLRLYSGP